MENKYLTIKTWEKEGHPPYHYAERLGKDSVAFILVDRDREGKEFGLIKEYKPPLDRFLVTAFGGSLDKDIDMSEIVREEVEEEAGYVAADIILVGKSFVSTQMNQYCYLYLVDVTNASKVDTRPQSKLEAEAEVVWCDLEEVVQSDDWKALSIIIKYGWDHV